MKLYLLFVLAVLGFEPSLSQPEPTRCCISRQFQASLTDLTTIKTNQIAIQLLALDFDRNMQATTGYTFNPDARVSTGNFKTIIDFNKQMQYSFPLNDSSQCSPRAISRPAPPSCVTADAKYLGSTYLGPLNALPYDGWRYPLTGTNATLTMAFTKQGCVPIVESVFGDISGDPVDFTFLFTSSAAEIREPNVFDIPPSCNQAP